MNYKTSDGITIIEGLEAVRRRPSMYIGIEEGGRSPRSQLLEYAVNDIARDLPQEIRILLWREGAVTVAHDGRPLPIEPFGAPVEGISHPALYRSFMNLLVGPAVPFGMSVSGPVLNALSEWLVVSTTYDHHRYRVVFSKGMLVTLLGRAHCERPLGITWLTFRPDATILGGEMLSLAEVQRVAERVRHNAEGVRIRVEDRTALDADWY